MLMCFQPESNFNFILAWAIQVIRRSQELEMMLHKVYHGNYKGSDPLHFAAAAAKSKFSFEFYF